METITHTNPDNIDVTQLDPRDMDGIEFADMFAGRILLTHGRDLIAAVAAHGIIHADTFNAWVQHHFVAREKGTHDDGDRDFVIHLPSGRTMDFRYWVPGNRGGDDRNYGTVGTMMSREDIIVYSDALASLVALVSRPMQIWPVRD